MAVVPVAEWVPDAAPLGNPGSSRIINAVPGATSYEPFPSFSVVTDELDAYPRGAITAIANDLNVYSYAGDETKLYRLSSSSWTDSSKSGGYTTATSDIWEFARWKNKVLATNFGDNPQQITMGGTTFSDLTSDFKARHIAVVRDFVVFGNTTDTTDGARIDRVRWSAINDETDYTVSPTTGSDFRDLNAGGQVQKIVGGEFGVIVSERSTWRMSFTGAPTWFQIDEVLPGIGTLSPGSVTRLGDVVYFLSENGFIALQNGTQATYIGAGRVDKFIRDDLDANFLHRISSVADPGAGRIAWAYPGPGNTGGRPNKIIIYDAKLNKWALIEQDVEILWRGAASGSTLEDLDSVSASIDALGVSLDSSQWKGGAPEFAAFNTDLESGFFTGSPLTATIETKETEIHAGHATMLNGFRPLVDGGTVTARVFTRSRQSDTPSVTESLSMRDTGRITTRSRSRYHRIELTLSGEWSYAVGVQIDPADARKAGQRG
jgi:hypothetical protein